MFSPLLLIRPLKIDGFPQATWILVANRSSGKDRIDQGKHLPERRLCCRFPAQP
jgi:hypothetical protein